MVLLKIEIQRFNLWHLLLLLPLFWFIYKHIQIVSSIRLMLKKKSRLTKTNWSIGTVMRIMGVCGFSDFVCLLYNDEVNF